VRTTPFPWPIASAYFKKNKINPKPQYQRGSVWSEANKQLLIDSIFRGYDIPKIYLRVVSDPSYEYEVVDGQQRLRALWDFMDNKFALGEESNDLPEFGDLSGKYFKDFSGAQQDALTSFPLAIVEIRDASENEIRELFLRLQEGKSLNPPEKRNAMVGKMRDFIASLAGHKVFLKTNIQNKRFEYDDWAAHITCLELNGGPTDLKAQNLKKMYEDYQGFDDNSSEAKKICKSLNYLEKILYDSPPEMKNKWGFVDLYWLVSVLFDGYDISKRHRDFHDFFISFEKERLAIQDPADLLEGSPTFWDRELFDYISAFQKEGAKRNNLEKRHLVFKRRFLSDFTDLVPKDAKRNFNFDERLIIWRRSGGQCEQPGCGKKVNFEEMHADHVLPHSKGGLTRAS